MGNNSRVTIRLCWKMSEVNAYKIIHLKACGKWSNETILTGNMDISIIVSG